MEYAHQAFIDRLKPSLRQADTDCARRLLRWLAPEPPDVVLYRAADMGIDALLSPWRDQDPDERYRLLLIDRLTGAYGDPRVRSSATWNAVDNKDVLFRWQVGATLDAFLDIVSKAEDHNMWERRRTFWQQLNKERLISEAWVALSPRGAEIARQRADETGENALREFGMQSARSNTSLLIIKINGKTVVERSHSYKVHIFPHVSKRSPDLYQIQYDCNIILRNSPDGMSRRHVGDWQSWVRERI